ncbi:MAG TPA: type IV pilus modification protein PilV [Burkholderiales bacterium]
MNTNRYTGRQSGFTLLEVLVALTILVFGLLGLIGMQAQSQIATFESYQRGQALILVQDMADRLSTNRKAAACYAVTTNTTSGSPYLGTSASAATACAAPGVGTAAMRTTAAADLLAWNDALTGAAELAGTDKVGGVLGARGCITFNATTNAYRVAVAWQGMAATVAPTAGDSAATCGKDQYGAEAQRREVSVTIRIASLT